MLLSKTCVNAVRAALEIAARTNSGKRTYIPVREVADEVDVSFHFLAKITQILTDAGILVSFRGPNGGVGLARPADKIHLIDIVAATDGLNTFESCVLGLPDCDSSAPCALHKSWDQARNRLLKELRKESLASVIRKKKSLQFKS